MDHEYKNQDHQEKYFLGIFHALHHLATKSAENRNSLGKILWCDTQAVLKKQTEKHEEHKVFGQKESGWGV